ncbi:MAG TPA: hypothetical protein VE077_11700 [Candidatus Methylomirabilis sp.]|nr:hypothetical protein [Candidatus Methylomirabilis sp.]
MASAQSQDSQTQSVAEAARKARAQKKTPAKPVPVITEDNLKPPTPAEKIVEAGADAKAQAASTNLGAGAATASGNAEDDEKKKKDSAELEALKKQLAEANKGLDLLQRQFALDQEAFLANPYHDRDSAGQAKLDALQQQIADKQQEVDALKTRVAAQQELVGAPAPAPAPQNPQP